MSKNTVTAKHISDMISDSEVHVSTIFDEVERYIGEKYDKAARKARGRRK